MAHGTADGSIVIDTTLDNDGFEKGADKLLKAMDGLTKRIEVFGSEMKNAFAGITNLLQNLTTATRGAGSSADTGAQQATQAHSWISPLYCSSILIFHNIKITHGQRLKELTRSARVVT